MPRQSDLALAAKLHQSRISMFETPGAANMTLETLAKLAAAFKVGLIVKFVPFHEMLKWENEYSQDTFHVTRIDEDREFENPAARAQAGAAMWVQPFAAAAKKPMTSSQESMAGISQSQAVAGGRR